MVIIYLLVLGMILTLLVLSRHERLPCGFHETGISKLFMQAAARLYHVAEKKRLLAGKAQVKRNYIKLRAGIDIDQQIDEFYIRKIALVIVVVFAGSMISAIAWYMPRSSHTLQNGYEIARENYGDGDKTVSLKAIDAAGNIVGDYEVNVDERQYTKQEADEMFADVSNQMSELILNENESIDHIENDLNLVSKVEGYPFSIEWNIDRYDLMRSDGKLSYEDETLIDQTGSIVNLTATYNYNGNSWQQIITVNLFRKTLNPAQRLYLRVGELLKKADEQSAQEAILTLPNQAENVELEWKLNYQDNSLLLMIFVILSAAAVFFAKDKDLQQQVFKRQNEILADYPTFISQLVLYLGAGMTVRNIFTMLSRSYQNSRKHGGRVRFLYEELSRANHELESGVSEETAYEHFAMRCGSSQYARLCTLLVQNLRKGNSELLSALNRESVKAFDDRMDMARKLGEEAGTKLLLPMMIMLLIVMVIIMIPAFIAF